MNSDFLELLKLLGKWNVDYVIIGGYAVMEYSEPRATKDLDVLVACSRINAKRVYSALLEFGGALTGVTPEFFAKQGRFYKIGRAPNRIDIITSAEGATYSEIKKEKLLRAIKGVEVFFVSRKHLLKLKRAAGRPQDIIDVMNLERFAAVDLHKKSRRTSKKR